MKHITGVDQKPLKRSIQVVISCTHNGGEDYEDGICDN